MKLRFLSIISLLLVSCGIKEYHYYNVRYVWKQEEQMFFVYVEDKEYKLKVDEVHYIMIKDYPCTDTCERLAYNEFYVKGKSYKLFVYTPNK